MTWSRVKPRSQVHDAAHAKARKAAALLHSPSDPCVRCGRPLGPMGRGLHYDHHDSDKRVYLGFSHAVCNLKAAGQLGRARQKAARLGTAMSKPRAPRTWG